MLRVLSTAVILTAASTALLGQCEPATEVRRILETAWKATFDNVPYTENQARRRAMYEKALETHRHDYLLLRMVLLTSDSKDDDLAWAKLLREKYPDQPVYGLIYAHALVGRDTPAALRMLESLKSAHPALTRTHLVLADNVFGFGKYKDAARARAEVEEFAKACPAPLDTAPLRSVGQHGSKELMAAMAAGVRRRVVEMPDSLMAGVWEALWGLEFKARPPTEHEGLRKQIAQDLTRLEKAPERNELRWLTFLAGGYQSAGDQASVKRINEEILAKHPVSDAAKRELQARWRKEHEYPRNGDKAQIEAYRRAVVEK